VRDILAELEKPGRDPRPEFRTASFADGINEVADLKPGMMLEGTVTNVAAFGAFVDIGVHQDGLVHVSQLSDRFVKNPHEVVKAGQIVKVRVVDVDIKRQRIALSMKKDDGSAAPVSGARGNPDRAPDRRSTKPAKATAAPLGSLGNALADALKRK
jgi:protein Tex